MLVDGVLIESATGRLITFARGQIPRSYQIPQSVRIIDEGAFDGCSALGDVTIGEGVRVIGALAFAQCVNLTRVTIPASIDQIDENPFDGCAALEHIDLSMQNERYAAVNGALISLTDQTLICVAPAAVSGRYVIPDNVSAIGYDAF